MILAALSFKSAPDYGWPIWRNVHYFEWSGTLDYDTARTLANEVLWFERSLELSIVKTSVIALVKADGEPGVGSNIGYAVRQTSADWPPQLATTEPAPWTHHLRLTRGRWPGRPVQYYIRGALNVSDVAEGDRGRVGLLNHYAFDEALDMAFSSPGGVLWPSWVINTTPGPWPVITTQNANNTVVAGASRLNAQRRAMARHLSGAIEALSVALVELDGYLHDVDMMKHDWYDLGITDFYPESLQGALTEAVVHFILAGNAIQNYLRDADSGTAGDQVPDARYLMTTDAVAAILSDGQDRAATAVDTINGYTPHSFAGESYFYQGEFKAMWDAANSLHDAAAGMLAFDFFNSYMAGPDSSTRGGYIPTLPDVDPSD